MSNINNKSINMSLKVMTILAFAFIFMPFNKASAQCGEGGCNVIYGSTYGSGSYNPNYYNPPVYQTPVYVPPPVAQTPVIHSTSGNPVAVVTYNPATVKKAAPKTVATASSANNANSLAANAVYGSNSFLPSGLIQWILLAIFILLIVILVRRISGAREKYQTAPMKHD